MFFHKITFRGSNDIEIYFDANLAPYCFPKSIQKRWKCRPQEAPDNASIFASFLNPQNPPSWGSTWNHLGPQFRFKTAQETSQTPPRGLPDRTWSQLGSQSRLKTAQEAFQTPLTRLLFLLTRFPFFTYALTFLLTHIWSIHDRLLIDFWCIFHTFQTYSWRW